jgi:hypothetical protein
MTTVSQFLGNRLLETLRKNQRPSLVNGCIDTYSRSNKYSLGDNETNPAVGKMFFVQLEKSYLKSKTVDRYSQTEDD